MKMPASSRYSFPRITAALIAAGFVTSASAQVQTAGTLFVDVDATALPYGAAPSVPNAGTLGGVFQGFSAPVIADSPGGAARGIEFNGTSHMILVNSVGGSRIAPPAGLVGLNPTRSIEVWAYNPAIADEETLVAWGRRGGGDGSNMSFNYGLNASFGAVGQWGAGPDIGWNNAGGAPAAGQWHHLVYTYDGTTTRVYSDGVQANSETLGAGIINTHANTAIVLAAQLEADGTTVTGSLRGSLFLAKVRIHDGALTPAQVANNYNVERPLFTGPVRLVTSPSNQSAFEGTSVTFTSQAAGDPPIAYQWRRGGTAIPGATSNSYTISEVLLADSGAQFSVLVTNTLNGTFAVSTNATLSVTPDTTAPTLVGASSASRASLTTLDAVSVAFTEKVTAATANNSANYTLTGPGGAVAISAASIDTLGRSVLLSTATLTPGANYTLSVSGIRDRSVAANQIVAGSQVNFTASQFAVTNIGAFGAGTATPVTGGYDISATGADIGGTSDSFGFHARVYVGDFDVQTRVEALDLSDGYSEAGLMARPQGTANAAFAAVLSTPSLAGLKFQSRASVGADAASAGFMPVNHPYTWLRLRRVGDGFTGFGSFDGQSWQQLGSATIVMPSTVLVGFAVSSHQTNATAVAKFREPSVVTNATEVSVAALPFEPLGPSSRRTGLVISEIMYHPADVPGLTNSLEFIEIYNGQDYFEDMSGYRIDGDVHFTFPQGTILQSGGFLVVARDPAAVQSYYGITGVLGPWRFNTNVTATTTNITAENLPNTKGTVRLENELGGHILIVDYDSEGEWPAAADGAGHSVVLARPSYGEGSAKAWAASENVGGSPGRRESYAASPLRSIVINEFLAHTDPPQSDFIELFNTSTQPVDIGGCWLSDDFGTNKFQIPPGTVLAARSAIAWNEAQLGFSLSSDGEEIVLMNPSRTRVLDVVRFGGQENGVSRGRSPDGAPGFVELETSTLGAANSAPLRRAIVINEIMYNPISGNDADEFIELHNRGASAVDLGWWALTDGVSYTIPPGTVIPAGGYLVIAKDRTNLLARHPGLSSAKIVGNYDGQLANSGERIALGMPDINLRTNGAVITTNIFHITVNEVTYGDGGRWGEWSDGGGSSLELIDADADNRFAANWADSDETQKAPWTLIERDALVELGMSSATSNPDRLELFLEGPGECLLDDVETRANGQLNRVTNPGFESGDASWFFQGTHRRSFVENGVGRSGNALHVVAAERGDAGANRIRTAIAVMPTGGTNRGVIRAYGRWLKGEPNILLRLRGQWMECAAQLTVPGNLGTPGAVNSRAVANAGPAISDVTHAPVLPQANEPIVVTARVNDVDGVASFAIRYRLDPATTVSTVTMRDDGTGGDVQAGDGLFSSTIPGQPAGTLVAFHLRATDANAAQTATLFPDDAPFRECLVRVGESLRSGSIASYRLWVTESNLTFWAERERNANDGMDCTFVYGNWRVVYNAKTLYSGSPFHTLNQPYTGPLGTTTCDYEVEFPSDDRLLGQQDFVLNAQSGVTTFFDNDTSAQAESTAYWIGRKVGLGVNYKRHVHVTLNGQPRAMIYFDHQQPNQDIVETYFPNDSSGRLHKIEDWFEFDDAGSGFNYVTCTLQNFLSAGQKRTERYRWIWRPRARTAPNDFADLFTLVDAANATAPEPVNTAVNELVDISQWMRHFAVQHTIGNWDTYGYERGKNCFAYKPQYGPWKLLLWDLDLVLGKGSRGTTDPLFNTAGSEPVIAAWYNNPKFVREFWAAMRDIVDGPLLAANYNPLVNARYAAFLANGVPVDSPDAMKAWMDGRRTYILSQIPNGVFNVTTTNLIVSTNNYVTISGSAPVTAGEILVNGGEFPITWANATNWTVRVPLNEGTNALTVTVVDRKGNVIGTRSLTGVFNGVAPDPADYVVINEIMYNPPFSEASFVELRNTHPTYTFDLSGWRINGMSFTFAPGTIITPRGFVVVGRNRSEFAKTYGALSLFSASFDGGLQNSGETLTLVRPGVLPGEEIVVDKVKYEAVAPWPANADGGGSSLQLIDAAQDNARVSSWSDGTGWRFFSITGVPNATRLLVYPDLAGSVFVDDMWLVAGTNAAVGSNYLVNGDFESPLAPAWKFQGTNATNTAATSAAARSGLGGLNLRFLPAGNTGQYIYQDVTNIVTTNVHTLSFWYLPSTTGSNIQFRFSAGFRGTVPVRAPTGPTPIYATPGVSNSLSVPMPGFPLVWLNEVQPINATGATDNQGEREPWIEIYNSGNEPISLDGLYLSSGYANLSEWAFPAGAVLNGGEFKTIFADGEPGESTSTEWHTNFRLNGGSGAVALSRIVNGSAQIVDYLNYEGIDADRSSGSCPDGQLFDRSALYFVTPGAANNCASAPLVVYINEWMAGNSGLYLDPADNDADDWFEIYNPNNFTVDLGGAYLTDNLANPFQFRVPENGHYTIPPRGHLLVWADNETTQNSTNRADLHANFQLRQAGEALGIFSADGTQIDAVTFGAQTNNVSEGRYPDGAAHREFMLTPTPRSANISSSGATPPEISGLVIVGNTVSFSFGTTAGLRYRVDYKNNLNDVEWTPLGAAQLATGAPISVSDNITSAPNRFYRIVVVP
jgi:hypothetical protein